MKVQGRYTTNNGYIRVLNKGHPRASSNGTVFEHLLIAEAALGRYRTKPECVHHVNENKAYNASSNLVVCPDGKYHKLLHMRKEARRITGDPNARKCQFCQAWDSLDNRFVGVRAGHIHKTYHIACQSEYGRLRYNKRKENNERL